MTEGLLIYFAPEEVASFARDLAEGEHFVSWVIDLASPFQLKLMQSNMGKQLDQAGAPFQFGPIEGAEFFRPHGWVVRPFGDPMMVPVAVSNPPTRCAIPKSHNAGSR